MSLIDHHVHTCFSTDASKEATIEAYIEQANKRNIRQLMFTDHVDLYTPKGIDESLPDYQALSRKLNTLATTTDIELRLGVELGYHEKALPIYKQLIHQVQFDFIIMSVHSVLDQDLYHGELFSSLSQTEAYEAYFKTVLQMVKTTTDYDVIGHLDYIIRYGHFKDKDYDFNHFKPIIDEILSIIIKAGKGIELNTSGLRYGLKHMHPKLELLKRYRILGGKVITLGSDAHHPRELQADFEKALKLLKQAGFSHVTTFKNRQPSFHLL